MMTNLELMQMAEVNKPLIETQSSMHKSLRALACVEVARAVYGRAELRALVEELGQLFDADKNARDHYYEQAEQKRGLAAKPGFEAWVDQEERSTRAANTSETMTALKETLDRLDAFKKKHPLVAEIDNAKRHGLS